MGMTSRSAVVLSLVALSLGLPGCITVNLFPPDKGLVEKPMTQTQAKDKILFLSLNGFIGDQEKKAGTPFIGGRKDQVHTMRKELEKAGKDKEIKAIVILIDSPGGAVTASDRLYHQIRQFREEHGIPVIAYFGDLGASGAYYAAMGATEVWAHPTSVVGSIGVLIANVGARGLMKKIGITDRTVSSGAEKEMGSPLKAMTPEDRKIFQGLIGDFFHKFLGVVEENRKISGKHLEALADGRVFSAEQALHEHLVDRIGYRDDLIKHLKRTLNLSEVALVRYERSGGGAPPLLGMSSSGLDPISLQSLEALLNSQGPTPLYLWEPGGLNMK